MPWHRLGTVSVTQNSATVTGVGTAFAANTRVGDAFIGPDGRLYELANVASDTVISISPPYIGPTASNATYAIAPVQGYQKALSDEVRSWVNSYGPKMAALGTTGNYEILPLNKGGSGLAANNNAELLAGIGAMPSAGGSYAPAFNSLRVTAGAAPAAGGGFLGWNETGNGSGMSGAMSFTCNQGGGTGGFSWRSVNAGNTSGGPFMTYSYAGVLNVPVGLQLAGRNVVESGSNANGNWVRFADGTQICTYSTGGIGATTASGNSWTSGASTWTFPAAFVSGSEPVVTGTPNSGAGVMGLAAAPTNVNASWVRIAFYSDPTGRGCRLMAVGRWF
ncbi:phage tail protein [Pseudomonas atacamensis]|uniref:phage tail protein n=1 Tax=Pseudomonas atacamensis TaxID=2565368 RepID=UPI00244AF47E|nr:phage tail protein [Pseudomonas atacamensis]MDH1260426.1 phage tail protein [Pseudomonas atacamensis]